MPDYMQDNWPAGTNIVKIVTSEGEYDVRANCRRIEATYKFGEFCTIPYVRVWNHNDDVIAEFCQHSLTGVYFGPSATPETGTEGGEILIVRKSDGI